MDINNHPVAPLSFQDAVTRVFNKYAQFDGRASRAEFWWFILFNTVVAIAFTLLTAITGWKFFSILSGLYNLAVLIPTLAVAWRRLHDIGKAGGWYFINFIPLVGIIIYIVWTTKPSEQGPNRFGEEPEN